MEQVSAESDFEHLAYIDESESARYNSKAVFSDVGIGVEVEEYDDFTLYTWKENTEFQELLDSVEEYFPFLVDPALEMIEDNDYLRFKSERDHDSLRNDFVYDPVKEWRGYERWEGYELIQMNLNDSKVVWDEKEDETRIRIYEIGDEVDVFDKIFRKTVDSESAGEIAESIQDVSF